MTGLIALGRLGAPWADYLLSGRQAVVEEWEWGMIVHTTASQAWQDFQNRSGLERKGRDAELIAELATRFGCTVSELDAKIQQVSLDELVRTLFKAVAPFAEMCRDIVLFFKEAGGATGRNNWVVALQEDNLDLRDFEQFASLVPQTASTISCPSIDFGTAHALYGEMWKLDPRQTGAFPEDVQQWLEAYDRGQYLEMPTSLRPSQVDAALEDASKVYLAALLDLQASGLDRADVETMRQIPGSRPGDFRVAFDLPALAAFEGDQWLRTGICGLASSLRMSAEHLADAFVGVNQRLRSCPRRELPLNVDLPLLQRILSLPIWAKRHEVYAVWIATEIRRAVRGYPVILHDKNGKLNFTFSEEEIATITSEGGKVKLIAERNVTLSNPVSKKRKGHAQPDYGLWVEGQGQPVCLMVVEVKHYKRSAGRSFAEMFVDYARAHPIATVAMAAHGPAGQALKRATILDSVAAGRCKPFGHLTPGDRCVREQFRAEVLKHVGPPAAIKGAEVLVIDISQSMANTVLYSPVFKSWLNQAKQEVASAILVDTEQRWEGNSDDVTEALVRPMNCGTSLAPVLNRILADYELARVATDREGAEELKRHFRSRARMTEMADGLIAVEVTA
ncbi:hypothetical protein [Sphingomonas sp. ABOLE]|uniref:hypothetical protein n=1 Tax=Sphingomonas sp. ABOLE TaxID=1985878 RepID=UPI000F7EE3E3|nr:hypothetical protein [Sphingomonas sp. ABOLE]